VNPPSALLTVEDVAARLRVSPAWVRDHATRKQPRLPVVRVGKLLRFRPTDVEHWIDEQMRHTC
jgi:excisionase family DNA binding protein